MPQFILDPESEFGKKLLGYQKRLIEGTLSDEELREMDSITRDKLEAYGYKYEPTDEFGEYRLVSSRFCPIESFREMGIDLYVNIKTVFNHARSDRNKIVFSLPALFDEYGFKACLRHETGHIIDYKLGFGTVDNLEALSRLSVIRTPRGLYEDREPYNLFNVDELHQNWGDLEERAKFLFSRKK